MDQQITPLATCQRVLTWISVYPVANDISIWKKILFKLFPLVIFATDLAGLTASVVFFWRYISTNLEECLYAIFQISGLLGMANSVIVTFILRHKIPLIFNSLANIYETIAEKELFTFLMEVNERSEWAWMLYFKLVCITCSISLIIMPLTSAFYQMLTKGQIDSKTIYHPFFIVLPWNQTNLFGYLGEICFDINVGSIYMFVVGVQLMLFISICLHHQVFYKIFQQILNKLNHRKRVDNDKQLLCELIRFRILVQKWFLETSDLYSAFILVQLVCFMLFLASNVFELELQLKHLEFSVTIMLTATITSASNLFLYCFFGKLATDSYLNMADCLFESNWQRLSIDLQKYLVMMIANAQKPIHYHGYGISTLQLETFTKILKTVFSFFMMFKTLAK